MKSSEGTAPTADDLAQPPPHHNGTTQRSERTVSQVLLEEYSVTLRPGQKGECPFCHHPTFSLKPDDTLAKCFHPACSRHLTAGRNTRHGLTRALEPIYHDCHLELLRLADAPKNAYTYVRHERGIDPQVIADAMLGAVPSGYDVAPHFQPLIDEAQAALAAFGKGRGRPTKSHQQAEERLAQLRKLSRSYITALPTMPDG